MFDMIKRIIIIYHITHTAASIFMFFMFFMFTHINHVIDMSTECKKRGRARFLCGKGFEAQWNENPL